MNGNCNFENIVYQANIFPKEGNFKEKYTLEFARLNGSSDDTATNNILLTLYFRTKRLFLNILVSKRPKINPINKLENHIKILFNK